MNLRLFRVGFHAGVCSRLLLCVLLLGPIMFSAAPAWAANAPGGLSASPGQVGGVAATVTAASAPVYAGPGLGFWTLGRLRRNAIVPVTGVSADAQFWQVNTQFGTGYLRAREVRVNNPQGVPVVDPGPIAQITAGRASVRGGPGIGARLLSILNRGQQVYVIGRQPDSSWLQIRYRFGTGWVAASLTDLGAAAAKQVPPSTKGPRAVVNAAFLNVRSGPGIQFTTVATLTGGQTVPILGRTRDGVWLYVKAGSVEGWINIAYVITFDYFGSAPILGPDDTGSKVSFAATTRTTVNVRTGPNIAFASIGTIPGNTQITVLGQSPDRGWWYVETAIGKGWVSKTVVRTPRDFSSLPVVQ